MTRDDQVAVGAVFWSLQASEGMAIHFVHAYIHILMLLSFRTFHAWFNDVLCYSLEKLGVGSFAEFASKLMITKPDSPKSHVDPTSPRMGLPAWFHVFFLLRMEQEALHVSLLALAVEKEQVGEGATKGHKAEEIIIWNNCSMQTRW